MSSRRQLRELKKSIALVIRNEESYAQPHMTTVRMLRSALIEVRDA